MLTGENYAIFGDVIAILLSTMLMLFAKASIIDKSKGFGILTIANNLIFLASIFSLQYHFLIENISNYHYVSIYLSRSIYYISLIGIFLCYNLYLDNLIDIDRKTKLTQQTFMIGSAILYSSLILLSPITKFGFYIENGVVYRDYILDPFTLAYVHFLLAIALGLLKYRKHFSKRIFLCIIEVVLLSVGCMILQLVMSNHTFTIISFMFPIILMFFLFHSSSYNYKIGTLNRASCIYYVDNLKKANKKNEILFLELDKFYSSHLASKKVKKALNNFLEKYFNNFYTFQLNDELFCLIYESKKECDLKDFGTDFLEITNNDKKIPFKIIDMNTNVFSYFNTLEELEKFYTWYSKKVKFFSVSFLTQNDLDLYFKEQSILLVLDDICNKKDLDDERVLVYCQPIWNVEKKQFKTAEILMRLYIDNKIIFPDSFISLAEENGYIHTLSLIILNKACKELKKILDEEYELSRISINFSILELKESSFCKEIENIIINSGVDGDKLAIELTESQEESEFLLIENKIKELKNLNIKFYLDDFGTGFSNFERLMRLPIDVIKFDRSMLLMSSENDSYKYMVNHFSEIFNNLEYKILFEGVESEYDENICIDMNANYLQGYKYSRPIPFEQIRTFLVKK